MEVFTYPATMAAGAALVSTPILIHLINRMRFRRVRWAAMEFLLKAQKRTRRKMILEQLILLLLRCLLVLLIGLLLARYLGFEEKKDAKKAVVVTAHVIVLDDTPSMADFRTDEGGRESDAFAEAKTLIAQDILPVAAKEPADRRSIDLLVLNAHLDPHELNKPKWSYPQITDDTVKEMRGTLDVLKPSTVRVNLARGLQKGREVLKKRAEEAREFLDQHKDEEPTLILVLHVVTDFRAHDWTQEGGDVHRELKALDELKGGEKDRVTVKVQLHDAALPVRKVADNKPTEGGARKRPLASDNIGIVDFRPLAKVTARNQPVDFEVRVKNFGTADVENMHLEFFRNGQSNVIKSVGVPKMPPGKEVRVVASVTFEGANPPPFKDPPFDKFGVVTVALGRREGGGLRLDNARHAIIEVQDKLAVLVVEGRPELGEGRPEGDAFYLKAALTDSVGGNKIVDGTTADLEKADHDLRQYACIFLANVPELSQKAANRLADYVQQGGGLGVFLGPDVKPESYNQVLYAGGKGLFPVELDAARFEQTERRLDDAVKRAKQRSEDRKGPIERTDDDYLYPYRGVFVKNVAATDHPAIAGLYAFRRIPGERETPISSFFPWVRSRRCWPVERFGKWTEDPTVKELLCLGNDGEMKDFEGDVVALTDRLKLLVDEPQFEKVRVRLKNTANDMRTLAAGNDPLSTLSAALDALLDDETETGLSRDPELQAFWGTKEQKVQDLQTAFRELRNKVKFGPPLYISKDYGAGRVLVLTTFTGARMGEEPRGSGKIRALEPRWTDWPGSPAWAPFVFHMYKHLSSGQPLESWVVGEAARLPYKSGQYREEIGGTIQVQRSALAVNPFAKDEAGNLRIPPAKSLPPLPVTPTGSTLTVPLTDATELGAYLLTMTRTDGRKEVIPFTVNLDARREGELRRASDDELAQTAPGAEVRYTDRSSWGTAEVKPEEGRPKDDLSTRTWLYVVLFLVLFAEQAMAVRISYHTRPDDLELHAPSAAAAYTRGHAPRPADAETAEPAPRETADAV